MCKYRVDNNCILAKEIANKFGGNGDISCPESAFKQCGECGCPYTANHISISLALWQLRKQNANHKALFEESLPIIQAGKECIKRGAGTILLRWFKFTKYLMRKECACNYMARLMDLWGPDTCLVKIDRILDWLRDEAKNQNLPFVRKLVKKIVIRAIEKSKKAGVLVK